MIHVNVTVSEIPIEQCPKGCSFGTHICAVENGLALSRPCGLQCQCTCIGLVNSSSRMCKMPRIKSTVDIKTKRRQNKRQHYQASSGNSIGFQLSEKGSARWQDKPCSVCLSRGSLRYSQPELWQWALVLLTSSK